MILVFCAMAASGLDVERMDPVAAWSPRFTVRGAPEVLAGAWTAGLTLGWAHRPLTLASAGRRVDVVEHLATADLRVGVALSEGLWVDGGLPVGLVVGRPPAGLATALDIGAGGVGIGDASVGLGLTRRGFAAGARLGAPTGRRRALLGGTGLWARIDLGAQRRWGRVELAGDLGLLVRAGAVEVAGLLPSHELDLGVAVGVGLDGERLWTAGLELVGATVLARAFDPAHTPASALGTLAFDPEGPMALRIGAGRGLTPGFGSPDARVIAGFVLRRDPDLDPDRDGVSGRLDGCPAANEDLDGFEDSDGCPDLDDDGDGVPDLGDRCPREPEDLDGFEDEEGCPDLDNDGDGVPDDRDVAPLAAEDLDGFQDDDGVPDLDDDGDGVPDVNDRCARVPETRNGVDDGDGCPDAALASVDRAAGVVRLRSPVRVAANGSVTTASSAVLGSLAFALAAEPSLRLRVSWPAAPGEEELAARKAEAVVRALVALGVSRARLEPAVGGPAEGEGASFQVLPDLPR